MRLHALMVLTACLAVAADDPIPADTLKRAQSDFNLRDRNGDGFLNQDEMPDQLKAELSKWDTNRDNLISLDEYKFYYAERMRNRRGGGNLPSPSVTFIQEEEDLDARPTVFRAGKLPAGDLPKWFTQLDTDKDGQVALFEWHKASKNLDEFREWDRNDDGYITAEEAIYKQRLLQLAGANSKTENGDSGTSTTVRGGRGPTMNSAGDEPSRKSNRGGGFDRHKNAR